MGGPIVRVYGVKNYDEIFGKKEDKKGVKAAGKKVPTKNAAATKGSAKKSTGKKKAK